MSFLSVHFFTAKKESTFRGSINSGQQIEYGGLSCSVGADETHQFSCFDFNIKIIYSLKTSKGDTKVFCL